MKVPAKKYIIQIGDRYLAEFIQYWLSYDKPCNLLWRKPNSDGVTAIIVTIETEESASFLYRAYQKIHFGLIEKKME